MNERTDREVRDREPETRQSDGSRHGGESLHGKAPRGGNESQHGKAPRGGDETLHGDRPRGGDESLHGDRPRGGDETLHGDRPRGGDRSTHGDASVSTASNSGFGVNTAGISGDGKHAPLFPNEVTERFRSRWSDIQTNFVDEPRESVEEADALVSEVTDKLISVFADNRSELERQWSAGDEVSTEDLRRTLQRYRSFFERLPSL